MASNPKIIQPKVTKIETHEPKSGDAEASAARQMPAASRPPSPREFIDELLTRPDTRDLLERLARN